ncbi:MAG: type VII toxin-antitoxin system MntA family adenylyltransferase antitoxin [Halothermotrichaceae bacterium]
MIFHKQILTAVKKLDIFDKIKMVILFGSQAKGDSTEHSDIDLAFFLEENVIAESNSLELRSELISILSSDLKKQCDIILINQAQPLLKYQIIKYGKLLYIKNMNYNKFFSRVLKEYFDFRYYLDFHQNILLEKLKKGGEV